MSSSSSSSSCSCSSSSSSSSSRPPSSSSSWPGPPPLQRSTAETFEQAWAWNKIKQSWTNAGEVPLLHFRPILPLEDATFRTDDPVLVEVLRSCSSDQCSLAVQGTEEVGTSVRIRRIRETSDRSLEVRLVGEHLVRLGERRAHPYRISDSTVGFVNTVEATERMEEPLTDEAHRRLEALARKALDLYKKLPSALLTHAPTGGASAVHSAPPSSSQDLSWWVLARLPLPAAARANFLKINGPEERLSMACSVLQALTKRSSLKDPLRARL